MLANKMSPCKAVAAATAALQVAKVSLLGESAVRAAVGFRCAVVFGGGTIDTTRCCFIQISRSCLPSVGVVVNAIKKGP